MFISNGAYTIVQYAPFPVMSWVSIDEAGAKGAVPLTSVQGYGSFIDTSGTGGHTLASALPNSAMAVRLTTYMLRLTRSWPHACHHRDGGQQIETQPCLGGALLLLILGLESGEKQVRNHLPSSWTG